MNSLEMERLKRGSKNAGLCKHNLGILTWYWLRGTGLGPVQKGCWLKGPTMKKERVTLGKLWQIRLVCPRHHQPQDEIGQGWPNQVWQDQRHNSPKEPELRPRIHICPRNWKMFITPVDWAYELICKSFQHTIGTKPQEALSLVLFTEERERCNNKNLNISRDNHPTLSLAAVPIHFPTPKLKR